jgi:hypothetical protein
MGLQKKFKGKIILDKREISHTRYRLGEVAYCHSDINV